MTTETIAAAPQLALTGATGRVGRLLRHFLPDAIWLGRGDDWSALPPVKALICLSGVTSGDTDALRANTEVALRALNAAKQAGCPRVMLLSSAAVYGRAPSPLYASAAPTPVAPYGQAKADMEAAIAHWQGNNPDGPEAISLRLGNVAGADALLGNLMDEATPALHVWPDGTSPRRSYIGPGTLARVFKALASADRLPSVLNVAAPVAVEMADLLRAAGRTWTKVPAPETAIAEVRLDTAPLERILSFPKTASTAEGMVAEWQEARA